MLRSTCCVLRCIQPISISVNVSDSEYKVFSVQYSVTDGTSRLNTDD